MEKLDKDKLIIPKGREIDFVDIEEIGKKNPCGLKLDKECKCKDKITPCHKIFVGMSKKKASRSKKNKK